MACVAAWAGSAITALFVTISLIVLKASPDQVIRELEQQQPELAARGIDGQTVISASFVLGGLVILWCAVSLVLATSDFSPSRLGPDRPPRLRRRERPS